MNNVSQSSRCLGWIAGSVNADGDAEVGKDKDVFSVKKIEAGKYTINYNNLGFKPVVLVTPQSRNVWIRVRDADEFSFQVDVTDKNQNPADVGFYFLVVRP